MSARVWSGSALASVLLHGAGLGAIALSTQPDIAPDQPVPKSRFWVEAADVPRSRARPETPLGEAAAQAQAQGTAAQSGSIQQSRATPAALSSDRPAVASSSGPALTASAATGALAEATALVPDRLVPRTARPAALVANVLPAQSITTAATPAAPQLASAAPVTALVTSAIPSPQALSTSRPVAITASAALAIPGQRPAAVAPATPVIAPSRPSVETTAPATPQAEAAAAAAPQSEDSSALPLPALAGKAALAWSGGDDTPVSATSLAAITAFTQEGDLAAGAAEVRDGIESILAAVPCARLQTTFLAETGQLELRGHIPEDGLRAPVLAALQAQVGDAIALSDQLLILPRPQCGALAGIAGVGLPQSTEQLTSPAVIGEDGFARTFAYVEGERLRLDLAAPDYDSYIYMDYFVADGTVIHLQPNDIVPLTFAPAKSAQTVGHVRDDQPYLELIVSPPFGQEIAAAFASNVPLYEGTRPIQEPAEAYLAFLKEQVSAARAAHPDFKGEWVYFFISTSAK